MENNLNEYTDSTPTTDSLPTGAFISSLQRNNRKIREDRAISISEDTRTLYKRKIEDLEIKIKKLSRERDNMLDLSPTSADSLVLASDFDGGAFVDKDLQIGIDIRNLRIQLEIAKARFAYLFENSAE